MGLSRPAERQATTTHWQRFSVPFDYPVVFTHGVFDPGNPVLADTLARLEPTKRHRCLVLVDSGVADANEELMSRIVAYAKAYSSRMVLLTPPCRVPGGEQVKNDPAFVEGLVERIHALGIDRHSYVIGVGGGAMLDAVGFAAATAHRGVRHVRIPTTVLAQNDSGVGVKNGINLRGVKNFVGTFAPPFAVINDFDFLTSLPQREKRAGLAEAVKVALIRDAAFFEWLERHRSALTAFEPDAAREMIERCAELHMRQIAQGGDPFEAGSARPLDFGHWAAHKLESLSNHALRHGEAVAIGMALDTRYSVLCGMLAAGLDERICSLLEKLGFELWHPALKQTMPDGVPAVLRGLREFREHLGGQLTITLLTDIGVGEEVHEMDETMVMEAIDWLETRSAG